MSIKIYPKEQAIAALVSQNKTKCFLTLHKAEEPGNLIKAANYFKDNNVHLKEQYAGALTEDVMLVHSILVTSNWNKNDDVFSTREMAKSRSTPLHKPVNIGHVTEDVVGCIIGSSLVDDSYAEVHTKLDQLEDGTFEESYDELPDKTHLLISMVIWAEYFKDSVTDIVAKIDNNEMFVSMETFFDDFGYAVSEIGTDKISLLERNEDTAWLSSSLRCYGGEGIAKWKEKNYKVGRWVRDLNFSGVGFVENPANPESIVFNDYISKGNIVLAAVKDFENQTTQKTKKSVSYFISKGNIKWQ